MKSIAPFCEATTLPAASVWAVTEFGLVVGIGRFGGPPGFEPPTATLIWRAFGVVANQLREKAGQSAVGAFAAIPYDNGADIAACLALAVSPGIRKKPTLPAMFLSKLPDSQSPSKISSPSPCMNLLIIVA